jgi:hypothetical protein
VLAEGLGSLGHGKVGIDEEATNLKKKIETERERETERDRERERERE